MLELATIDENGKTFKNELLEVYFDKKEKFKELCHDLDYKYIISIDGETSEFLRGPLILMSTSVPLIVESEWTPLYMKSWIPWVHYVPIKKDLSNLLTIITWLNENDADAK